MPRGLPRSVQQRVLPVGLRRIVDGSWRPKVVSHYLLEKMREGGVQQGVFYFAKRQVGYPGILRQRHCVWNRFGLFDHGKAVRSTLYSRSGLSVCAQTTVAVGFPDILFEPRDAFARALDAIVTLLRPTLSWACIALTISGFGTWSWSIEKAGCANWSSSLIRRRRNWVGFSLCGRRSSRNLCTSISQRRGRQQSSLARIARGINCRRCYSGRGSRRSADTERHFSPSRLS